MAEIEIVIGCLGAVVVALMGIMYATGNNKYWKAVNEARSKREAVPPA